MAAPLVLVFDTPGTVISSTSESAGYPASAIANALTYERWKPSAYPASAVIDYGSAVNVDCVALMVLDTSGVINVESSADNSVFTSQASLTIGGNYSITNNTPVTARYWRVTLLSNGYIGAFSVGNAVYLPDGLAQSSTHLRFSRKTDIITNASIGGNWIGRSVVKQGLVGNLVIENIALADFEAFMNPLIKRMRFAPFAISSADGEFYCWATQDPQATRQPGNFISVTIPVEAYSND